MPHPRKLLSITLSAIAVICLLAALCLFIKGKLDDRQTEELLSDYRVTQDSSDKTAISSDAASTEPGIDETAESDTDATKSAYSESSTTEVPDTSAEASSKAATGALTEETPTLVTNPYAESFLANKDMAAWLVIPDTEIDYPVMWTPEDETYYLYRDFEGKENKNGCLLLDTDSSVDPLTTNLIIHGHNMKSGAMFGTLTDYENQNYYENHKQIVLYTEECRRNYEVIAVFRSQVFKKTDQVFKFYQFFQADTEEEFNDFYENIKALSLYDTGVTAEFGDNFITLSTCVYHVEQGRFVVVAKEVESGDSYLPIQ